MCDIFGGDKIMEIVLALNDLMEDCLQNPSSETNLLGM